MERIDICDLAGINERLRAWAAPGEFIRSIVIQQVVVQADALDALAESVRHMSGGGPVLVVCDRTAMRRGPDDLKQLIEDRLSRANRTTMRRLPADPGPLHADLPTARQLASELSAYAAVVSLGSGSVTDVVKYARHLAVQADASAGVKFVSFPTAASVTAFTSALAVLAVSGVKRTLASRPPDAVICDLRTLADAPPIMTQAGFGDVMARSVAYGDYFLANEIGMDDGFSMVPGRLLETAEQEMIDRAAEVAAGGLAGVRAVVGAVLLAGMAMSVVNQTAPISGWEHVMSHFFDMTAGFEGRQPALHGGQVGAAALVSARAYERAWRDLDLDRISSEPGFNEPVDWRRRIASALQRYCASESMLAEILRDYEKKMTRWQGAGDARRRFAARKRAGEYEAFLSGNVRPSATVSTALSRAGAPQRFEDLDQPIGRDSAHAAVRFSHLIRARFTLGDLLERGGWLDSTTAACLLETSAP